MGAYRVFARPRGRGFPLLPSLQGPLRVAGGPGVGAALPPSLTVFKSSLARSSCCLASAALAVCLSSRRAHANLTEASTRGSSAAMARHAS